jgi:host factor-I protein
MVSRRTSQSTLGSIGYQFNNGDRRAGVPRSRIGDFASKSDKMTPPLLSLRRKTPPPGEAGQEALHLCSLSQRKVPVAVKLRDGETVKGWIEYFADDMLRLTREGKPKNLFTYKHQTRTITEADKRRGPSEGSLVSGVSAPRGAGQ